MRHNKGRHSDPTPRLQGLAKAPNQRRRLKEQLADPGVCKDFKRRIIQVLQESEAAAPELR